MLYRCPDQRAISSRDPEWLPVGSRCERSDRSELVSCCKLHCSTPPASGRRFSPTPAVATTHSVRRWSLSSALSCRRLIQRQPTRRPCRKADTPLGGKLQPLRPRG